MQQCLHTIVPITATYTFLQHLTDIIIHNFKYPPPQKKKKKKKQQKKKNIGLSASWG